MTQPKVRGDGLIDLDTSDVDRWIGKPVGGARLIEPVQKNDVRRWAQGMANPNPLFFDENGDVAYVRGPHPQALGETFCPALVP